MRATLQAWQESLPVPPPPRITHCEQNEKCFGRCQILLCWNSQFVFSGFKIKAIHWLIIFNNCPVTVVTKPTSGVLAMAASQHKPVYSLIPCRQN